MNKKSSYKILKDENLKLKQEIYELVMNENKLDSLIIKMRYKIIFETEKQMWL